MNEYENKILKVESKPICRTRKVHKNSKAVIKNRIIGISLLVIGTLTLFIPADNGESDGTAFIMLTFMGLAALFSKE